MVQQPVGVGPFWPHTALGPFWPISQLDSLWDVAIHTEAPRFVPVPFQEEGPAKAESGVVAGVGAGAALGGELAQYCQPVGLGDTKFQCTLCRKLFRAPEFVYKHVQEKHRTASGGYAAEPPATWQPAAPAAQQRGATSSAAAAPAAKSVAPAATATSASAGAAAAAAAAAPAAAEAAASRDVAPAQAVEHSLADQLLSQADFLIEEVDPEAEGQKKAEPLIEEVALDAAEPAARAPEDAMEAPRAPAAFSPAGPEGGGGGGQAAAASEGERWTCPKCQETNKASRDKCNGCGADRPAQAAELGKAGSRAPEASGEAARPEVLASAPPAEAPAAAEASAKAEEAGPRTIEDLCKAVASGKFQCVVCSKMFKGPDFVFKHLRQKHPVEVDALAAAPGGAGAAPTETTQSAAGPPAGPECLKGDDVEGDLPPLAEVPPLEEERGGREARNDREASISFDDEEPSLPTPQELGLPDAAPPSAQMDIDESVPPQAEEPKLARGSKVEVTGLSGRADLNGCKGVVTMREGTTGRFEVKLDSSSERVRVKPENLVLSADKRSAKKGWGDEAFKEGKTEQAIGFYASALQEGTEGDAELEGSIRANLSAAHCKKKDYQKALDEASLALNLRPSWAAAHARRGFALLGLGRSAEAQSAFIKALQFDPASEGGVAGLGQVTDQSAKDSAPSSRQAEAEGKKVKGNEAVKVGDLPAAVAFYTMAIALLRPLSRSTAELQHSFAVCCSNRSAVFAKLQQWRFAFADAEEAKKYSPNWFKAHIRASFALLGLGHAELSFRAYLDAGDLPGGQAEAAKDCLQALWRIPALESPLALRRMRRFDEDRRRPQGSRRIFAISGVHVDQGASVLPWAEGISSSEFTDDILMVSSLGDTLNAVKRGLKIFKGKFRRVFYVPGNHDLWIRPGTDDSDKRKFRNSVDKLLSLFDLCEKLGVEMMPAEVMENVFVVPLLSWWTCCFCTDDPKPGSEKYDSFCRWPMGEEGAHEYFLRWNEPFLQRIQRAKEERSGKCEVISFSHFLPAADIPAWEVPAKAAGCQDLEGQVARLGSRLHLFGHTRRSEVHEIRGVTYQQHTLMSHDYSHSSKQTLLKVYDGHVLAPGQEHTVC